MKRIRIGSDTTWEKRFGYARAARAGPYVAVSGTVAADAAGQALPGGAYEQTREVLRRIGDVLGRAGGGLDDLVRLRVYYARPDVADGFARALLEAFPAGAPALTTVRVESLVSPEFLVEIEADAVVPEGRTREKDEPRAWDEEAD